MEADQFLKDNRVNCVLPADYQEGGDLDMVVKAQVDLVDARANVNRRLSRRRPPGKTQKREDSTRTVRRIVGYWDAG